MVESKHRLKNTGWSRVKASETPMGGYLSQICYNQQLRKENRDL